MTTTTESERSVARLAAAGLWLIPVYTLLLALTTLTSQPDAETEFEEYARYVITGPFLVSHLVGSILGAALGLVGLVAALLLLVRGPAARLAAVATAVTVVANCLLISVFAVAAFTQPVIGRTFLEGDDSMREFDSEVYSAPVFGTVAVALLLFIAGAVLVAVALARTSASLRWPAYLYAAGLTVFSVAFLATVPFLQPLAALVATVGAVGVARGLPAATARPEVGVSTRPSPAGPRPR